MPESDPRPFPVLDPASVEPRRGAAYPEHLRGPFAAREKRALGDPLGLTSFGVNLTRLPPGTASALRQAYNTIDRMPDELPPVTGSHRTPRWREVDSNFRWRVKPPATQPFRHVARCIWGQNRGQYASLWNGGREMARPASNLHLQPKNGGWRARVLVPVELQAKLGKKLFHTPVWRVSKSEAAVLAYPEVQKFEALIKRAKSGGCFCEAVEVEVQGPPKHLAFPSALSRQLYQARIESHYWPRLMPLRRHLATLR
jgi:hypothetical protein